MRLTRLELLIICVTTPVISSVLLGFTIVDQTNSRLFHFNHFPCTLHLGYSIYCTFLLQATSHDLHGAGRQREGEEAREKTGGWGDTATGDLGEVHHPHQAPGKIKIFHPAPPAATEGFTSHILIQIFPTFFSDMSPQPYQINSSTPLLSPPVMFQMCSSGINLFNTNNSIKVYCYNICQC